MSPIRRSWQLLALSLLAGCSRPAPPKLPPPIDPATQAAAVIAPGPTPTTRYVSREPVIEPLTQRLAEQIASFTWTATPSAANVPDQGVTGMLHKRPFRSRHVAVAAAVSDKLPTYRLRFSNQPRGELCGFSLDDDSVSLEWSEPSGSGEWIKPLDEPRPRGADAWFVIEQPGGVPLTTNADFACYLQITELRGPTEANGAPSLIGRVVICFNDPDRSWIAGTFAADGCR